MLHLILIINIQDNISTNVDQVTVVSVKKHQI